jgi:hypothetical protein
VLGAVAVPCLALAPVWAAPAQAKGPQPHAQLVAFHSRFGGSRFGGRGLSSRRRAYGYGYRGYGSRYGSRPSLLHRIARALAFAYILHLLFTNGVFSVLLWLLIIAIFSHLFRRRARRYPY